MDSAKDPFTRRMLHRASLRRNREGVLNLSSDDARRRLSILQAIDDRPSRNSTASDCQTEDQGASKILEKDKRGHSGQDTLKRSQLTRSDTQISGRTNMFNHCSRNQFGTSCLPSATKLCQSQEGTRNIGDCSVKEGPTSLDCIDTNMGDTYFKAKGVPNDKSDEDAIYAIICKRGRDQNAKNRGPKSRMQENDPKRLDFGAVNCSESGPLKDTNNNATPDKNKLKNSGVLNMAHTLASKRDAESESSSRTNENNMTKNDEEIKYSTLKRGTTSHNIMNSTENNLDLTRTSRTTSLDATKDSLSSPTYVQGFELGKVKWRGPLYNAARTSSKHSYYDFQDFSKFVGNSSPEKRTESKLYDINVPKLLKVQHKEIEAPQKMRAQLRTIDAVPEIPEEFKSRSSDDKSCSQRDSTTPQTGLLEIRDKLSLPLSGKNSLNLENDLTQNANSTATTPLSAAIRDLDAEIQRLEFRPSLFTPENMIDLSPPDRIYPNLMKIKFTPTGYTPKKLYQSPCSPEISTEQSGIRSQDSDTQGKFLSSGSSVDISQGNAGTVEETVSSNKEKLMPSESKSSKPSICPSKMKHFESDMTLSSPETVAVSSHFGNNVAMPSRFSKNNPIATALHFKSPKSERRPPNLESTRQSSNHDLTKMTTSRSRLDSSISTITMPNTPTTPENPRQTTPDAERKLEATIPYEVERFLEDALGDELYNTTVTFAPSEAQDRSISQYNASELISEDSTPISKKHKAPRQPMSDPRPQHVSTFDRTMTFYKSFTQRIKKKFRPGLKVPPKAQSTSLLMTVNGSEDEKIQALLQEANIQQTLMYQASKALNLCRSMKEFLASPEQVESERLLLVAALRKSAALEEIKKLNYENNNDLFCERGEVTVKEFSLALKEDVLSYERQTGDFVQWFVIAVSHGPTVWATHAISCPINSPRIHLPGSVSIPNLTPGFKITVRVYSLKLRRVTYNHDDKYHLNQDEKHTTCPSPKRFLRRSERPLSPKQQIEFSTLRNTSFALAGAVDLQLHDLTLTAPWPMTSIPMGTVLKGTIDLTLSCKLHLSVSHAGFLTHGDEAGGFAVWNRRWCVLQGHTLMFWNYPRDQENKSPLESIDLMNCISDEVTVVDRSLCARPRTLLVETARRRSMTDRDSLVLKCSPACTIVRNLLSCDTAQDLTEWTSKLNHVISALREWNVTTRRPQLLVSDL